MLREGCDPLVSTQRSKLQQRRAKLNQQINRELRLRSGAENLYRASSNQKVKETVALELSFVNSNLQLLKEELEELNSSMNVYQTERLVTLALSGSAPNSLYSNIVYLVT
uniref:REM-1 domain-containing protein n=1 Tax=Sinocyclocheilus rhinocerous TaxID=307959 RepID=A0A673IL55_9TELE